MTGILMKQKYLNMDMYRGEIPCENEGRDQGDASTSQGMSNCKKTTRS